MFDLAPVLDAPTESSRQLRRVLVEFSAARLTLEFQAEAIAAWGYAAACSGGDPKVTVDDLVTPGLKTLPCAELFLEPRVPRYHRPR